MHYAYADFDDERLANLGADQLNDVLEVLYKVYGDFNYLFLDEIQNVEGWHLFVNRLLRKKMHVIVTGSNAKLLSGELATHLSGRAKEIHLFPFSFREYCAMNDVEHFVCVNHKTIYLFVCLFCYRYNIIRCKFIKIINPPNVFSGFFLNDY